MPTKRQRRLIQAARARRFRVGSEKVSANDGRKYTVTHTRGSEEREPFPRMRLRDVVDKNVINPPAHSAIPHHTRKPIWKCSACDYVMPIAGVFSGKVAEHVKRVREDALLHQEMLDLCRSRIEMFERETIQCEKTTEVVFSCKVCEGASFRSLRKAIRHLDRVIEMGKTHAGDVQEEYYPSRFVISGAAESVAQPEAVEAEPAGVSGADTEPVAPADEKRPRRRRKRRRRKKVKDQANGRKRR